MVDGLRCASSASSCAASAALMGPTTGWSTETAAGVVGRFDSLMIALSCAREEPKAADSRYQAVDAASCCDHARQVVEDDRITAVTRAQHELTAVVRLCAENGIARAADAARGEVQVCP